MRLLYFDLTQGNRIGMEVLFEQFKFKALPLIAKLKYRELFDSPFKILNQQKANRKRAIVATTNGAIGHIISTIIRRRLFKKRSY
jgi:hypothetical protein